MICNNILFPAWDAVFEVPRVLTVGAVHGLPLLVGGADPGQVEVAVLVCLALVRRPHTPHYRTLVLHPVPHLVMAQSGLTANNILLITATILQLFPVVSAHRSPSVLTIVCRS